MHDRFVSRYPKQHCKLRDFLLAAKSSYFETTTNVKGGQKKEAHFGCFAGISVGGG